MKMGEAEDRERLPFDNRRKLSSVQSHQLVKVRPLASVLFLTASEAGGTCPPVGVAIPFVGREYPPLISKSDGCEFWTPNLEVGSTSCILGSG